MKIKNLKIIIILSFLLFQSCYSQKVGTMQYLNFYNSISPKLNELVPNKTQFYNQNFLNFYNEILSKNLVVQRISTDGKIDNSKQHYVLTLHFCDYGINSFAADKGYQYPVVRITFQNQIPDSTTNLVKQNQAYWNSTLLNEFSNILIESIEFGGINGYNNSNRTPK